MTIIGLELPPWPVKTSFVTESPFPAAVDANTFTVYGIKFSVAWILKTEFAYNNYNK